MSPLNGNGSSAVLFRAYAETWLARRARAVRPRTSETYAWVLARYVFPTVGALPLATVTRAELRETFDQMAVRGMAPATIRLAIAVVTAIFNDAVDAEVIVGSPIGRLSRRYRGRREPVAVYDERELCRFLETAAGLEPELAPFFALCARAGLRVGEARGIRGGDCDLATRRVHVTRQIDRRGGREGPPKGGRPRFVDLSASLVRILEPLVRLRSDWLFPELIPAGGYKRAWKAFRAIAAAADLRVLTIHSLRHSYASILLSHGVSPVYAQRQLGHAGISLTCDLYGSHFTMVRAEILDGL